MAEKELGFKDLKLPSGQALQLDIDDYSTGRDKSSLIGYLSEHSIIITTPTANGVPIGVTNGTDVTVRFFSQQLNGAGAFRSKVLATAVQPYPHLHLSIPQEVAVGEVRRAIRASVNLIASLVQVVNGDKLKVPAVITDISAMGARVEKVKDISSFRQGDQVTILSRLSVGNVEKMVSVNAVVRNISESRRGHILGLEFVDVEETTHIVLHAYTLSQVMSV